jgi:hypothetical protein
MWFWLWLGINSEHPCWGGVEYLYRSPASHRRRRKGKSRIWDSRIWSRVPLDSDARMTALTRASRNCKRTTHPLVRESVPHQKTLKLSDSNKNLVVNHTWVLFSRTDWPTDRRSYLKLGLRFGLGIGSSRVELCKHKSEEAAVSRWWGSWESSDDSRRSGSEEKSLCVL